MDKHDRILAVLWLFIVPIIACFAINNYEHKDRQLKPIHKHLIEDAVLLENASCKETCNAIPNAVIKDIWDGIML